MGEVLSVSHKSSSFYILCFWYPHDPVNRFGWCKLCLTPFAELQPVSMQASRLQQQAVHTHPELAASSALSARISDTTFPKDVEEEANSYYHRVCA